jgi:hypothetical protein
LPLWGSANRHQATFEIAANQSEPAVHNAEIERLQRELSLVQYRLRHMAEARLFAPFTIEEAREYDNLALIENQLIRVLSIAEIEDALRAKAAANGQVFPSN